MPRQIQGSQTDFSFGEVDPDLKRNDAHPARKGGLRQMKNARIHNSGSLQNRPGRSALFPANVSSRIEEITMSPGNLFKVAFGADGGNGSIRIFDANGVQVKAFGNQGSGVPFQWTLLNVNQIVFAQLRSSIYVTFPGMKPQVLTWDGTPAGWTIADFAEFVLGGQKRTFFYRISPQNITIVVSDRTGAVTINASEPIFKASHVGTRIRYINRQILIVSVVGPYPTTIAFGVVQEALPGHQALTFSVDPTTVFSVGDVIRGTVTGSVAQVVSFGSSNEMSIQLLNTSSSLQPAASPFGATQGAVAFTNADTVVGQGGSLPLTGGGSAIIEPAPTTIWDEEVMNATQGYPASCFVDQFRLGFCDFPAVPNGIGWSAINSPTDLYVGGPTAPNGAMFEVAPDKARVQHVIPGPEGSEFVFCDHKIFYIKVDRTNPLIPGSVAFQLLAGDGAARVQPRIAQDVIFYVNAGGNSVMAVTAPGAYYRPFSTINLTEFHSHLFSNIAAIAAPNADGTFNERYVYALNADGTLACGKYRVDDGKLSAMGWGPWSGGGTMKWIAATNADVLFTTSYFGFTICEILDDTQYLDGSVFVNALPAAFAPPPLQGPLWWLASQTVSLMDQVTRSMGTYQIDASGFIVPLNNGGENLALASLVAGQPWTGAAEPFAPDATSGADMGQRMKMRGFSYFAAYVLHSTGFKFQMLFSGKQTRTSPPLGTPMNERRVPAYNMDDDTALPPIQRETAETYAPQGTTYDPRVAIVWDTPGPFQLLEIAMELTP